MRVCLNLRLDRFLSIECPSANRQSKRPIRREPPRRPQMRLSTRVRKGRVRKRSLPSPADFWDCR